MTTGELLDAAVALLRTRAGRLIGWAVLAAAAEQAVLFPLRRLADLDIRYLPADDRWPLWTLLVAVGFGTEALIIAGLAGPAAAAAPGALLGRSAPPPEPPARPAVAVAVVATIVGLLCGLAVATMFGWPATFFLLSFVSIPLWAWLYGSLGLAAAVVVLDRRGPLAAIRRSLSLAQRQLLRTARVRVLGYLGWFLIRLAWGIGVLLLVRLVYTSPDTTMDNVLMAVVYLLANTLAYPMLACLDVVLLLDTRMRTEGLDIALRRRLHRGVDATSALASA
jgi:hypothetical protein